MVGQFLLYCNFDKKDCPNLKHLPTFYKEVLYAYFDFRELCNNNRLSQESIIWNNRQIRIAGNSCFVKELFDISIWYIEDCLMKMEN